MSKKRILIVDDDASIRDVMEEVLLSEGFDVDVAENGQDAIDRLQKALNLPDLILVDLMMPVKDGVGFLKDQQNIPRLKTIPSVIMTADGQIESKIRELGIKDFLKKPIDLDHFTNAVKRLVAPHTL
ncbi:MAG: response regulator [Bdellovibrionales bacterium]|nr:response regulator [Bdellovibrionales bacterium]